jgi:hypothetical protein
MIELILEHTHTHLRNRHLVRSHFKSVITCPNELIHTQYQELTLQGGRMVTTKTNRLRCVCDKGWTSEACATPTCRGFGSNSGCGGNGEIHFAATLIPLPSCQISSWATCSQAFAFHRIAVNVIRDFLAQTAALSRLIFRPFFSSGGGCLMRWHDKFSNIQGSNGKFFFTEEDSNRWQMDAFSVNYFVHFCWTVFMMHDWDLSHSIHTRRSN